MLSNLKKGDRIITSGGLYGRITGITDATLTLEIADKVRVKVSRGHVAGLAQATISGNCGVCRQGLIRSRQKQPRQDAIRICGLVVGKS